MTAGGVIVAILLLVVALNLDRGRPARVPPRDERVVELFEPRPMGVAPAPGAIPLVAAEAGWIESVDAQTGRLRQRHRFERLDPSPEGLPAGWLALERPEAQIFLSGGRVVTMRGDAAVAHAPHQTLEQGTLRGNVLITMHETDDRATAAPILMVRTEEASFDQRNGEVRCDGRVLVELIQATIPGERLSLLYNDMDGVVERLVMQQEYVLIKPRPGAAPPDASTGRARGAGEGAAGPRAGGGARGAAAAVGARGGGADAAAPSSGAAALERYRLTMSGNVRVRQHTPGGARTATGDELSVLFSARGGDAGGSLALGPLPGAGRAARAPLAPHRDAAPLPVVLARLALGWNEPAPGPGETLITADGPLTVVPWRDEEPVLASPRDQLLTLSGAPLVLIDEAEAATASAALLRAHTLERAFELLANEDHPVTIESPSLSARGDRFWYSGGAGRGGMSGAGTLSIQDDPAAAPAAGAGDDPFGVLRVRWAGGVDLDLDEGGSVAEAGGTGGAGGKLRLRRAVFDRDVHVEHPDLELDAARLTVGFAAAPGGQRHPEAILAEGQVHVRRVADYGRLSCGVLDVSLTRTPEGSTQPTRLRAEGDVEAIDRDQVMWADELLVTFRPAAGVVANPSGTTAPTAAGSAQVETLTATGDVQVLLEDGSRAFGDRLVADAARETAELSGRDVVVAPDDRTLIDHGQDVRLVMDRASRTARWEGPGEFRTFGQPILEPGRGRIRRPRVDQDSNKPEARARWNRSMVTDAGVGAGRVDLEGAVDAVFGESPLRRDTLRGERVGLSFAWAEPAERPPAAPTGLQPIPAPSGGATEPAAAPGSDDRPMAASDERRRRRVLRRLLAEGDARLESRERTADPSQPPRVFYAAGDRVEYDHSTGDADVVGQGTLLLQDLLEGEQPRTGSPELPFSGKGTTMFNFARRLELRGADAGQRVARMFEEVAVRHQATDGRIATLTAGEATAWMHDAGAGGAPAPGGAMALRRVRAVGSVFVRAASREVECDDFDHDVATGIARVSAAPGRLVSIVTAQARIPYTAQSVVWDLRHDRISITGAGAAGGR
jgi:hypothetical protein